MICSNILSDHSRAVTGPLVRNDTPTIEKNIRALEDKKELQEIYKTFAKVFTQDFKDSEYLQ